MVLWELTLGTAYFLGLKRTYRLFLRIQCKIISPKHYKIRQFAHRRTRAAFDVALKVHRNIQERDIEVGRNLGNFILRWLDRMKPSAQIRRPSTHGTPSNGANLSVSMTKHTNATPKEKPPGYSRFFKRDSNRHHFTSSTWPKPFPTIAMMMRPPNPAGTSIQHRRLSISAPAVLPSNHRVNWSDSVVRKDILQWMQRN